MKTAKRMGIKTVAIHSEHDYKSKHVEMADESVCVGPPAASNSYLIIDRVIKAAQLTGAQAIHPGYGFLSENNVFAEEVAKAGIAFVGPDHVAISALGDKIQSKILAKKAGVHIIPGELVEVTDIEVVLQMANQIGYPIMIKAAGGGGGKGMRIAWNDQEARDSFRITKQEAASAFGDDRILIEKFIDNPRHIEIQVLSDGKGNTLYLNERECSIQRRNQKVLEEAPSSFLDPQTRKAMGEQACALANTVGYRSAGTCEFLVDPKKNFYFLEMNTRLQVEHPVTEYTTGLDLVELMIRIAAGEKLSMQQKDVPLKGWAMEARVYAEDPVRNFLPSIGTIYKYVEPKSSDGTVRVDSGIREGDEISIHWDPLISKLVTYGKDRKEAIDKLAKALDSYIIRGVNHNVPFLRAVLEHPRYIKGDISTKFIPQEYPEGFKGIQLNPTQTEELVSSAAVLHFVRGSRDATVSGKLASFERPENRELTITVNDKEHNVVVEGAEGYYKVKLDGKVQDVQTRWHPESTIFTAIINSKERTLQLVDTMSMGYQLQHYGTVFNVLVRGRKQAELAKFMPVKQAIDTSKMLQSPMPGKVISVAVQVGDKVNLGQEVLVLEAMKMQNILRASRDCTVKSIKVKKGDNVNVDQILVEFD